jgi:molybdopterin-guanine dinucleotide biosynthesis protein A
VTATVVRHDVSALILAGDKARRLGGVDKREIVVEGRTIFERQVEALAPRVAEILVSSPGDPRVAQRQLPAESVMTCDDRWKP